MHPHKAFDLAEKLTPKVVLKPIPNASYNDRPGYKTYLVMLHNKEVGRVYNERESNHRYAGRLICGTSYSKKWNYDLTGSGYIKRYTGLNSMTRKGAIRDLLEDLLRRDALTPTGKVRALP